MGALERFDDILAALELDRDVQNQAKAGNGALWTRTMINFLNIYFPDVKVEAREVELEPLLQHTFLKITISGDQSFICDGTGTIHHDPFFGYESEAPKHLQNSKSDIINKYL